MEIKLKNNTVLFYLSYIILYAALFLGDVYNTGEVDTFARILRLCSYVLIVFSCINLKIDRKGFLQLIGILMLTLIYGVKTGDWYWSILVLLIYNSKKANIKSVFNVSCKILICGIIIVLTFCAVGFLPDILTARNSMIQGGGTRHSLGFYHSNVLPLLIFYLEVYYICIAKESVNRFRIAGFMLLAIIVSLYCNSRNSVILSVALSLFVIFEKRQKNNERHRILYAIAKFSMPAMVAFSFLMMFLLPKGGIWDTIDYFFSGRFRLAIFKMRRLGLHLINIMNNEDFINDNILYVNGKKLDTIVLDNGYLFVILRYGVLIVLFYFVVSYILLKKSMNNCYLLGAIIAVFIANFVDNDLVDYSFLPFILWAFNDLERIKFVKKDERLLEEKRI